MVHILVINDKIMAGGENTYQGWDYRIYNSDTPLHAFNQIIHINPDAIIICMEYGNLDGIAVYKRIRNMQASKDVPVLFMVNPDMELEVRKYDEPGKTGYLILPALREDAIKWVVDTLELRPKTEQKSILVVDDDPAILDIVELYLGAKYRVRTVRTKKEAIAQLSKNVPDVILLDIAMPDVDGKELYKEIRLIEGCANVPILFQTGMAGVKTVRECVKLGAAGFVIKPIQKNVLLERIDECLNSVEESFRRKLFVFEEFDFLYTLLSGYLSDYYFLERAPSALQSLTRLDEYKPDIIIVDADNYGYMLARIREKAEEMRVPMLLLTQDANSNLLRSESWRKNTHFYEFPLSRRKIKEKVDTIKGWVN